MALGLAQGDRLDYPKAHSVEILLTYISYLLTLQETQVWAILTLWLILLEYGR